MGGGPRGLSEAVLGATALLGSIGTCQPQTHTGAATAGIAGMEQGMFLVPHVETTQVDGIKGYTSFTIAASPTPLTAACRVYVGVCHQCDNEGHEDDCCFQLDAGEYKGQVRTATLHWRDARDPRLAAWRNGSSPYPAPGCLPV